MHYPDQRHPQKTVDEHTPGLYRYVQLNIGERGESKKTRDQHSHKDEQTHH